MTVIGADADGGLIAKIAALNDVGGRVEFERSVIEAIRTSEGQQVWLLDHDDLAETMRDDTATLCREKAVLIVPINDSRRGSSGVVASELLGMIEPTHDIEIIQRTGRDPTQSPYGRAAAEPACWLLAAEWDGRRRSGWLHLVPKRG